MNQRRGLTLGATILALGGMFAACGGGGSSPTAPNTGDGSGSGTGGAGTAVLFTITAAGVSPKELTVPPGTRVQFRNSDSRNHTMNSDPHPDHTDCQEINQVGFLTPGQTKETGALNDVRTCGFHDHELAPQPQWEGRIIIRN